MLSRTRSEDCDRDRCESSSERFATVTSLREPPMGMAAPDVGATAMGVIDDSVDAAQPEKQRSAVTNKVVLARLIDDLRESGSTRAKAG